MNFIDIIILISASQSLFFSIIIYLKYGKTLANKTLALLMFFYTLVLTEMILIDVEYFRTNPYLVLVLIGSPFLMSPLHYLYAKYLTRFSKAFKSGDLFHIIPFVLYLAAVSPELIRPQNQIVQSFSGLEGPTIPLPFLLLNWLIMIQVMVYTLFTIGVVKKYSKQIKEIFSSVEKVKLDWLRNLVILFSSGIILYIIENMLITGGIISNNYSVSSIVAGVYVYVLGYLALFKSQTFASPEFAVQIEEIKNLELEIETGEKKYLKSGLSDETACEYLNLLLKLMEEKEPYLDSELTLNKLAGLILITPHNLSEVINKKMNQNFFDFINKYRVEKVKKELLNPQKQNLTLLAIALDAGFNSKSSFNTIFKKQTGMTPTEFRKKMFSVG